MYLDFGFALVLCCSVFLVLPGLGGLFSCCDFVPFLFAFFYGFGWHVFAGKAGGLYFGKMGRRRGWPLGQSPSIRLHWVYFLFQPWKGLDTGKRTHSFLVFVIA